jgi:hypothetical protein
LPDRGYPGEGVANVGEGGAVDAGVVAEACGHAFNVKSELVGEGVGGRRALEVATDVASNEAAAKGEAEELLRVREPISEEQHRRGTRSFR